MLPLFEPAAGGAWRTQVDDELDAIGRRLFYESGWLKMNSIDGLSWPADGQYNTGGVLHIEVWTSSAFPLPVCHHLSMRPPPSMHGVPSMHGSALHQIPFPRFQLPGFGFDLLGYDFERVSQSRFSIH